MAGSITIRQHRAAGRSTQCGRAPKHLEEAEDGAERGHPTSVFSCLLPTHLLLVAVRGRMLGSWLPAETIDPAHRSPSYS